MSVCDLGVINNLDTGTFDSNAGVSAVLLPGRPTTLTRTVKARVGWCVCDADNDVAAATSVMRVLLANHTSDWSGAEVALLRLATGLAPDHDVAVACPPAGPLAEAVDRAGHPRLRLPQLDLSLRPHALRTPLGVAQVARAGVALRKAASIFGADVVHANSLRTGLIGAVAASLRCPPIVVQVHEHLPPSPFGTATRRAIARTASAVVGVTDYTAENFNRGLGRPVATRVYISIDQERFHPGILAAALVDELGLAPGSQLLGEVAQITPWKGQDTAIRALASIRRALPDVHLLIVGHIAFRRRATRYDNASYRRELDRLVQQLGLRDHVHFVGQRDDVPAVLRALDLSVLPSWDEPFGTVAAESMAVGTPPMVGAVGGVPEYVEDGVSGRVLPPNDPEAWAIAAIELLSDPERLARMGDAARNVAVQFTDARYAEEMVGVYERALDRSRRSHVVAEGRS